jgi:hypothetical protein
MRGNYYYYYRNCQWVHEVQHHYLQNKTEILFHKAPHSAAFVDNLIVAQLPTKLLAFYVPLRVITAFTQASHWALF